MLSGLLPLDRPSTEPALITPTERITWADLKDRVSAHTNRLRSLTGKRVGFSFSPTIDAVAQLVALASLPCHVFLIADDVSPDQASSWAAEFAWATVVSTSVPEFEFPIDNSDMARASDAGAVTILTSGTTGIPKAVEHTWESLTRPVRRMPGESHPHWLLTFRPHLYAGIQVILQCLTNHGALAMPGSHARASDVVQLATAALVTYASATPSYWRWLLTSVDKTTLGAMPLRQITLGGEVVDQAILDALTRVFPTARVVHIYATTELGRCFSVTDGLAGFPANWLGQVSSDGVVMRIDEGELVVRSANAMRRYGGTKETSTGAGWFHTGDLVHREGDRVFFAGRKTDMINVGGNKVHPIEVEQVIRQIPGVADVRVYGRSSSLVGQLVACDLVVSDGFEPGQVEQEVREATLANLASFQRPRWLSVVDAIPLTRAGKTRREE